MMQPVLTKAETIERLKRGAVIYHSIVASREYLFDKTKRPGDDNRFRKVRGDFVEKAEREGVIVRVHKAVERKIADEIGTNMIGSIYRYQSPDEAEESRHVARATLTIESAETSIQRAKRTSLRTDLPNVRGRLNEAIESIQLALKELDWLEQRNVDRSDAKT